MGRVGDEFLSARIHHEIQHLQRHFLAAGTARARLPTETTALSTAHASAAGTATKNKMWTFIIVFLAVYAMLHKYLPKLQVAQWAIGIASLATLLTAAAYPNIPPPLSANDIPLTEAGVAAILAYMTKFAVDTASSVKNYLGFNSSSDGHPGKWMSSSVQGQLDLFADYLKGTAPAITTGA